MADLGPSNPTSNSFFFSSSTSFSFLLLRTIQCGGGACYSHFLCSRVKEPIA